MSAWGSWTTCTVSCGEGTQSRTRTVTTATQYGGVAESHKREDRECNKHSCPINCQLNAWTKYTNVH